METNISPTRVALRFGLLTGLVLVIYSAVIQLLKLYENQALSWLFMVILIAGMYLAMQDYKKNNEGYMSYGQGITIGSLLSAVSGLLSGIFSFVYFSFIDNSFIQNALNKARIDLEKQGNLTDAQIDQAIEISSYMLKPGVLFVFGVLGSLFFGFIFSLVVSAILKKNRPEFE